MVGTLEGVAVGGFVVGKRVGILEGLDVVGRLDGKEVVGFLVGKEVGDLEGFVVIVPLNTGHGKIGCPGVLNSLFQHWPSFQKH